MYLLLKATLGCTSIRDENKERRSHGIQEIMNTTQDNNIKSPKVTAMKQVLQAVKNGSERLRPPRKKILKKKKSKRRDGMGTQWNRV